MKNLKIVWISVLSLLLITEIIFSTPINQYINTVTPTQNAVSVNKSSNITIVFIQDMNPATITNANIKVFGFQTGLLPVTIDYNPASKTANINPNQDMKAGEKISVTLTSGIRTVSNESITPFVNTFYIQAIGGNGIFTRVSSLANLTHPIIKSGDIDNDGDIDLVLNNFIYKNNGNALFTFHLELNISGHPELADFDNDGDLDILIQNGNNVYFFQNNGVGIFFQISMFAGSLSAFGDLNGDGFLDISYLSNATDLTTLLNINGNFSFNSLNILNTGCIQDYTDNVLIDDMDNDGDMDIIAINGTAGGGGLFQNFEICRNFYLLDNNGQGIFNSFVISSDLIIHSLPFVLLVYGSNSSDLNNDGYVDLITPSLIINNNTDGSFSNGQGVIPFCNSSNADFNGDGYFDIIGPIPGAPLLAYFNDQSGNLIQFETSSGGYFGGNASGDFDNDGDIDLAFGDYGGNTVGILLNGDIPLPIELSSFTSETEANNVTLSWSTSMEENNAGFDIERSSATGGVKGQTSDEWNKAGYVNGNGNSNSAHNYTFTDKNLQSGKYKYRLKQTDFNGNFKHYDLSNEVTIGVPEKFYLSQNYPNPFNPVTNLGFGISESGYVSLKVYDSQGKKIVTLVNENKSPGYYNVQFSAAGFSSGVYFYRLESNGLVQTKRMMILK